MKKKLLLIFLLTAAATTATAVACTSTEHQHNYNWQSNAEQHWEECECGEKQNDGAHADANTDGKCDVCGLDNYALTFDMQGHGTAPAAQNVYKGAKGVKPATDPSATGYIFGGWYADAACETPFDFDAAVSANSTVYAKWSVTVTFNMKGCGAAVDAQTVKVGGKAVKPATDPVDANHEYLFEGWYSDEDCETPYDFTAAVSANITLYAKWVPDTRPLVTFDLGENADGTTVPGKRVDAGSKVEKPDDPEVYHYTFDGWYTSDEYETEFDFENTEITKDTTIYAKLTYDRRAYVTFDVLGHGTAPAMQIVEHGGNVEVPEDPSEDGYVFGGWYTSTSFRDYFDEFLPEDEITGDITLYAKWMVTVFFHLDDGAPAHVDVKVGDLISEQHLVQGPNGDFDFGGWYTDPEYNDEFVATTPINVKTDLYAKWVPAMPKLTLETFKNYSFGSENTLQFSFTAPSTGRYKIEPYNVKAFACYFTTDIDEEGVYYGEGYDANEKIFRLTAGQKIIVTLYRGDSIEDTDKVSLFVSEVEDDFPDNWVSGTYTDGQITIEFNKEDKTVKWDDVTYPVQYSETSKSATFKSGSYTCEIKRIANDTFTFQYHALSTVTIIRVEKQEMFDVDKFSGVYEPVNSKLGKASKVAIYKSGNGYITMGTGSSAYDETYTLGEYGASYVYDGVTNVLQYQNYRITANLNGDGDVVSISISNPTIAGGSVPIVYTRTGDAPVEVPDRLPLPSDIEFKGAIYGIKCDLYGGQTWSDGSYITITDYNEDDGYYTIYDMWIGTFTFEIEGSGDDTVIKMYDASHTNLVDTLTKYVINIDELIKDLVADGTHNDFDSSEAYGDWSAVFFRAPKKGTYTFSSNGLFIQLFKSNDSLEVTGMDGHYFNDYQYVAGRWQFVAVTVEIKLKAGDVIALALNECDPGSYWISATVVEDTGGGANGSGTEADPYVVGVETFTIDSPEYGEQYYLKFTAPKDGKYRLRYYSVDMSGNRDVFVMFSVDGVNYGYDDNSWSWSGGLSSTQPYTDITFTEGQTVSIVLTGGSFATACKLVIEEV